MRNAQRVGRLAMEIPEARVQTLGSRAFGRRDKSSVRSRRGWPRSLHRAKGRKTRYRRNRDQAGTNVGLAYPGVKGTEPPWGTAGSAVGLARRK